MVKNFLISAPSLAAAACKVLETADPSAKVAAGAALVAAWRRGDIAQVGTPSPHHPSRPARPARPELRRPGDMPRRRTSGLRGRIALLHAIAHIELNAVDLAWDIIARFAAPELPRAFYDDWVGVAGDEGRHFTYLTARLGELGAAYGDLPAHDGLWQAAADTAKDLTARLAIVPMVLEARGLDVTPAMVGKLQSAGDAPSAAILQIILKEEIGHVSVGRHWFEWSCNQLQRDPVRHWQDLVRQHFKGGLKPPFNHAARQQAGLTVRYYQPD